MRDLTLVFDLDGTLVDTAPDLIASTNHVLDHLGLPPVDAEMLRPWVGHGARYMIERAVGPAGENLTPAEHAALLERYLDYYGSHIADGSQPFDGLLPLLDKYKADGVKLAVCTNKNERMSRLLLDALDMSHYFTAVAGRDTLPNAKPHPDALLGTIAMAGGEKSRAVMIGDSGVDVATAKAAGVPVIGVSFGYTETPVHEFSPDAVIDHYRELEPAIGRVLAASRIDGAL
jgi:phosphoglycolate phosphatase